MAKEETKAPKEAKNENQKLSYEQLASFTSTLQERYKSLMSQFNSLNEQLRMYQMQDYYQRLGVLWDVVKNGQYVDDETYDKAKAEFKELLFAGDGQSESTPDESGTTQEG